jgi:hypothetical protein
MYGTPIYVSEGGKVVPRGVGASIATMLADRGFDVVITVAEFAFAIAEAATTAHPSGHTVFVGITD